LVSFFSKENNTNHKPLRFTEKLLIKGESLFAVGWTYSHTIGEQRIYEYTCDTTEGDYHHLIQINGPKNSGGLSGAPIVYNRRRRRRRRRRVIGFVSSVLGR
jgi:hypothetical protein